MDPTVPQELIAPTEDELDQATNLVPPFLTKHKEKITMIDDGTMILYLMKDVWETLEGKSRNRFAGHGRKSGESSRLFICKHDETVFITGKNGKVM
jgi:hypothetical protein